MRGLHLFDSWFLAKDGVAVVAVADKETARDQRSTFLAAPKATVSRLSFPRVCELRHHLRQNVRDNPEEYLRSSESW